MALRWYHDRGQPDPWETEEISRPDYTLPKELGGLHIVVPAEAPATKDACRCGQAPPAPDAQADDAGDGPAGDPTQTTVADDPVEEVPAGANRAQRRRAQRTARKTQRPPSKPPDPSPPNTPSSDAS